jgi:hypothetical protein
MSSIAELQEWEARAFRRHHWLAKIAVKAKTGTLKMMSKSSRKC